MPRLLIVSLLLIAACTQGAGTPPAPAAVPGDASESMAVASGWMGRFSRRDPELATLLRSSPGWGQLRDMSLFEAMQSFETGERPSDRIGAARAYLALADLCGSLDRLLLEVEGAYFASSAGPLSPAQRARRLVVLLRAGETGSVEKELAAGAPAGFGFTWQLVTARHGGSRKLSGAAVQPSGVPERAMGRVAAYLWGFPPGPTGNTPYDHGVDAFRSGDRAGGVLTLQLLEFSPDATGPGPELFLYRLLEQAFAGLAREALADTEGVPAGFLGAVALGHLGETEAATALYRSAAGDEGPVAPEALLFSPITGAPEMRAIARVRAGDDPIAGAGPLEILAQADSIAVVNAALQRLSEPPVLSEGEDASAALPELYAARQAAGARQATRMLWGLGDDRRALNALARAHRKSSGYRPDFVNPPGFLVDLARAYQRVGEYAPAVAVLFELSAEYPSARVAYESLKRLYASHTGGEVPPR